MSNKLKLLCCCWLLMLPFIFANREDSRSREMDDLYTNRRHHIAHFCPNLDEARKCIRKCMKEGRPAFCGKDHVCYCGHRNYDSHDTKKKKNPDVNMEFSDLYEKYFGPNTDSSNGKNKESVNDENRFLDLMKLN